MKKIHTLVIVVYGILLVLGALLFTLDIAYSQYLFAAGAVLAILQTLVYAIQNRTDDRREARLQRLNFIASLFLGVAAWLMFAGSNSWLPMVIIYAVVTFFLSFRGKK